MKILPMEGSILAGAGGQVNGTGSKRASAPAFITFQWPLLLPDTVFAGRARAGKRGAKQKGGDLVLLRRLLRALAGDRPGAAGGRQAAARLPPASSAAVGPAPPGVHPRLSPEPVLSRPHRP